MISHQDSETPSPLSRRVSTLTEHHRDILIHAIENICNTDEARITFAQVSDGVPVVPLLDEGRPSRNLPSSHPSRKTHQEICPGILERLDTFRRDFDAGNLQLNSQAMTVYQSAAPGSRLFNTRLIELVSRSVHQIAIEIALLDESPHREDGLPAFIPPESDTVFWRFSPSGPPPTWLRLMWYQDYTKYPNGSSDIIEYWAENYIIGGVILFDRRVEGAGPFSELGGPVDSEGVYIHSERYGVTYRICKLLDAQKKAYLNFLQADANTTTDISPLPLKADQESLVRVDPEEPILETGIYRDSWERPTLSDDEPDARLRDVFTQEDYPRAWDYFDAHGRAQRRQELIEREQYGEQD